MSSAITRLSRSDSGTSLETIRCASPSTIAVLPTPGSPISTGLFLVRRESTWITRRISSSRPITGSSLPSPAAAVRSRPKRSSGLCSSSWGGACAIGFVPAASGAIAAPSPRPERRAHVGQAHQLSAAVRDRELGAERAAHLLELLGQADLRVQRLELELVDAGVHALDLSLQVQHPLDAREVQAELRGHLLDSPELLHVLLGVQAGALRRASRLDQPARLVHAQRLRMHLGELRRDRDHEHAAIG